MKDFFRISLRNVLRNRRRTILTALIVTLGILFSYTIRGFLNGLQWAIIENASRAEIGDIQITRKGFREALPAKAMDFLFSYNDSMMETFKKEREIYDFSGRLMIAGLINHQESQTTTPFVGVGIEPIKEVRVCPLLPDLLMKNGGSFLDEAKEKSVVLAKIQADEIPDADPEARIDFSKPVSGKTRSDLQAKVMENHQILVGNFMREGFRMENEEKSRARVGDELVLLTGASGSQRSIRARLTGVMNSPNPMANKSQVYLMLATAQNLIDAKGKVNIVAIRLKDQERRKEIAQKLNSKLAAMGLVAEPWDDISKFFSGVMFIQNVVFSIIISIMLIFVIVAIVITSTMSVSERTREIGTLMSIGYHRRHIMTLFIAESSMIATGGAVIGLIMGVIVIAILNLHGIPFLIPGTTDILTLRPFNSLFFSFLVLVLSFSAGILGSIFPAIHASRLSPMEAMVHI